MNPAHFYLATDGLGPGTTHYIMSVLGRRVYIEVIVPPDVPPGGGSGGGGGSYAVHPGVFVPWPKATTPSKNKTVLVIVKLGKDHVWRRAYNVKGKRGDITIKAVKFVNASTQKLAVGVEHVRSAARRVTAFFKPDDK